MATPVLEDIALQIVQRLEAGTYTYPLLKVIRPNRTQSTQRLEDLECRVYQGTPQPNPEVNTQNGGMGYTVPYAVVVQLRPSDKNEEPLDSYFNIVFADLVKAIAPSDAWHTWNDLAVNTDFGFELVVSDDHSECAAIVTVNVDLRLDWTDPYTAR